MWLGYSEGLESIWELHTDSPCNFLLKKDVLVLQNEIFCHCFLECRICAHNSNKNLHLNSGFLQELGTTTSTSEKYFFVPALPWRCQKSAMGMENKILYNVELGRSVRLIQIFSHFLAMFTWATFIENL